MFRDLKEYQEIAKIYADKVSKPEDLEERVKGGGVPTNPVKPFEKPAPQVSGRRDNRPQMKGGITFKKPTPSVSNKRAEMSKRRREMQNNTNKEPEYKPEKGVVFGQRTNEVGAQGGGKPSSGDLSMFKDKKPEVSTMTNQGKPRTKAQMMAAKRIGSGTAKNPDTTIAQVKKSNEDSMRARAKERFAAFKAKRAEKKAAMVAKEELTPYDYVLEYLLSSEQAATIEEANYVMTEMDAETIQGIVEAQKKTLIEKPDDGYIGPKFLGIKTIGQRRKEFQLDSNLKRLSKTGDSPDARTMLNIPLDYEITPEQKEKYGFK